MKLFISIGFVLLSFLSLTAQTRAELQNRKKKLLEEIELSNTLLDQTLSNKKVSLHQLKALKQKIAIRSQLIRTIQSEVGLLREEIDLKARQQIILTTELDTLKSSYKRLFYIRQISNYRVFQADEIAQKTLALTKSILVLENQKKIKQNLISDKRLENQLLNQEQAQESISLASLSEKEKELSKVLDVKRRKRKKIQQEIERIIAEELRKVTASGSTNFTSTPEALALSEGFATNKGKLPWPVAKGMVISKFGKQKHPVLSGVVVENNGVEIATESHSSCRSVFKGKVSSVLAMPNGVKVVMIRHGEYISVYANLSEVYVQKGEEVSTKTQIGLVFTSKQEGSTVIDFQLWKGSQKMNPQSWLMNK
jgi:septal ring factor EnvC (AmiA/AmiB activator)